MKLAYSRSHENPQLMTIIMILSYLYKWASKTRESDIIPSKHIGWKKLGFISPDEFIKHKESLFVKRIMNSFEINDQVYDRK